MFSSVKNTGVCMRLNTTKALIAAIRKVEQFQFATKRKFTKRQIYELIFDHCVGCLKMAAVPQGAFAVRKVREMNDRKYMVLKIERKEGDDRDNRGSNFKKNLTEGRELTPLKYNSKLMNSIWGLYNRYSVHNFKKNTDAEAATATVFTVAWESFFANKTSTSATSTEVVANATVKH